MEDLDLTKSIDFEVVGDIKSTIIEILGYYDTAMTSDCDLHLKGTNISLPAFYPYLTYYAFHCDKETVDKKIIMALYQKGLIKIHEVRK